MAIKNKDGTPYRLAKPNPIMSQQSSWDGASVILHNFKFNDSVTKTKNEPEEPSDEEIVNLEDIIPEEIHVEIKNVDPNKIEPRPKKKISEEVKKDFAWCLPAKTETDVLYGDSKNRFLYGEKFSLEVIVVSQQDITATFWTNVEIGASSILFIVKEKRWWKVSYSTPKYQGFILDCIPSDITPSFQG